jgi:myo-inositol catabolism protein IolC
MPVLPSALLRRKTVTLLLGLDNALRAALAVLLLAAGMDDMLRGLAVDRVLCVEEPHTWLQQQLPLPAPEMQTVGD